MIRLRIVGLALAGILFLALASCSSDAAENSGLSADNLQASAQEATGGGDDGGGDSGGDDSGGDGGGDTTINIGGDGDSESEKLPDWAVVLLVIVAVLAVIGVVVGHQNRSARRTSDAAEEGYRRGRQDAGSSTD